MKKRTHSEFVQEMSTANPGITVLGEYVNTNTKILCECKRCGHQWMVRPYSVLGGTGCPKCAGNLKKTQEEFVKELNAISPEITVIGSYSGWDHKIKVRCDICGNEWSARAGKLLVGRGCPKCNLRHHTSFPEQAIYYYVKKVFPDAITSYDDKGYELDVFIPSKRVAVEYDGYLWHKTRVDLDNEKDEKCVKDGITLLRIREVGLVKTNSAINIFREDNYATKELDKCITRIFEVLGVTAPLINSADDRQIILSSYIKGKVENSIVSTHPDLAEDWDYQNNHSLLPEMFSAGSSETMHWKCRKCGHRWAAVISDRAHGNGCPACSRRVATTGKNDITTLYPQVASEWNYEKNGSLMPNSLLPGSSRVVWWKCKNCGGEWEASIENRCKEGGTGCPYCYGRSARVGKNDLKTVNPELAEEWHPTKNKELTPESFLPNSNKKVWWYCKKCGNEWQAVISNRTKGSICPKCAQDRRTQSFNLYVTKGGSYSLATSNPALAAEWHPTKNGELTPRDVTPRSGKKTWWKCHVCGYEWQATVANRNKQNGTGCPCCAGKVLKTH